MRSAQMTCCTPPQMQKKKTCMQCHTTRNPGWVLDLLGFCHVQIEFGSLTSHVQRKCKCPRQIFTNAMTVLFHCKWIPHKASFFHALTGCSGVKPLLFYPTWLRYALEHAASLLFVRRPGSIFADFWLLRKKEMLMK